MYCGFGGREKVSETTGNDEHTLFSFDLCCAMRVNCIRMVEFALEININLLRGISSKPTFAPMRHHSYAISPIAFKENTFYQKINT